MPPILPAGADRQAKVFARPANQARALAHQQQGGQSGVIPGTSSAPEQVAVQTGMLQEYPATALSPNGGQVAGIGHTVLNNAGQPVVVMGNLNAVGGSDHADFQDGGFAFVDAAGNQVAGYSQPTGLWGFGGGRGMQLADYLDWAQDGSFTPCPIGSTAGCVAKGDGTQDWVDNLGNIQRDGLYVTRLILNVASGATGYGRARGVFNEFPLDFAMLAAVQGALTLPFVDCGIADISPAGPGVGLTGFFGIAVDRAATSAGVVTGLSITARLAGSPTL